MKKLNLPKPKKILKFTDIHFGKKLNSPTHNQDCINFITWLCDVAKDNQVDQIDFLGDYYEHRNAINIDTLDYGLKGAELLNQLNIPIIFMIGNHDLYHRNNRTKFSTKKFKNLDNFHIISEPTLINDHLYLPYLFKNEYDDYSPFINNATYVSGHLEFNDFVLTGHSTIMTHGIDYKLFNKPKYIFSGHYHKRQIKDNIVYIGNTFPMDYSDANDNRRGLCIHDTITDDLQFIDWADCPKYKKVLLSELADNPNTSFGSNSYIKCIVDVDLPYSDIQEIRELYVSNSNIRDFVMEEQLKKVDTEIITENLDKLSSIDDLIIESLTNITDVSNIDNNKLLSIYLGLTKNEE